MAMLSGTLSVLASGLTLLFIVAVAIESSENSQIAGGAVSNSLEHLAVFASLAWAAWNSLQLYRIGRRSRRPV
jgi:hypothetical protein